MGFVPNEIVNTVFFAESVSQIVLMFIYPFQKICGHANIQGAISLTRKNVNIKIAHDGSWIPAFAGMTARLIVIPSYAELFVVFVTGSPLQPAPA